MKMLGNLVLDGAHAASQFTQASHGFSALAAVRLSGASWVTAQANAAGNAEAIGLVSETTADTFALALPGTVLRNLSGLTEGATYYLSAATAGELTTTAPSTNGQVVKPMMVALSSSSAVVLNHRGTVIGVSAASTTFTPAGSLAATDVQAAMEELDEEKQAVPAAPVVISGGVINRALGDRFTLEVTEDVTLTITNPQEGKFSVQVTQSSPASAITWFTGAAFPESITPLVAASGVVVFTFEKFGSVYEGTSDIAAGLPMAPISPADGVLNLAKGQLFTKTITGDITFSLVNAVDGLPFNVVITMPDPGFEITWWSGCNWKSGTAPTLPPGETTVCSFIKTGATFQAAALLNWVQLMNDASVAWAKLADIATARFAARATAGTGPVEFLTATQARTLLELGTAALLNVGTGANQVVQLDGDSKLPAVDGSQLTGLAGGDVSKAQLAARILVGA